MGEKDNTQKLLEELSQKLGISNSQIKNSAKNGNVNNLLKNLNSEQAKSVKDILDNPEKTKKILNTPEAQALLKLFGNN